MLAIMLSLAVATLVLGALSKTLPDFPACRPEAGRPTERDLAAMKKRFYYPSTKMLATAAVLGSAWYLMRSLHYEGLAREICGAWSVVIAVLAVVTKFFENIYELVGDIFGFGPHRIQEFKAHARIEADERKNGYAPAAFLGKLGFDVYGAFWQRRDGSRNRMV